MESRMEKYYKENPEYYKRSKRNESLYKNVYKDMNSLENLPIPDNSNEIDIDGLKKIISSRDESLSEDTSKEDKRRVYDINVLLETAKNEVNKSNEVEGKRLINANFLTDLEDAHISDNNTNKDEDIAKEVENKKEENISTDSLPLDILVDLKGSDNTIVTDPIVKDEVTMIKKIKEGETFYSGSFNFSKKDFADEEEDFFDEKPHNGLKIFFLIIGFILLAGVIYLAVTKYILK